MTYDQKMSHSLSLCVNKVNPLRITIHYILSYILECRMSEQQSVLLFGRTGYGKSSIANMLVQGEIYQNNNAFTISDSARGETLNIYTSCTGNIKYLIQLD